MAYNPNEVRLQPTKNKKNKISISTRTDTHMSIAGINDLQNGAIAGRLRKRNAKRQWSELDVPVTDICRKKPNLYTSQCLAPKRSTRITASASVPIRIIAKNGDTFEDLETKSDLRQSLRCLTKRNERQATADGSGSINTPILHRLRKRVVQKEVQPLQKSGSIPQKLRKCVSKSDLRANTKVQSVSMATNEDGTMLNISSTCDTSLHKESVIDANIILPIAIHKNDISMPCEPNGSQKLHRNYTGKMTGSTKRNRKHVLLNLLQIICLKPWINSILKQCRFSRKMSFLI